MSTYYCSTNNCLYDFTGDEDTECSQCGCYYEYALGPCDCCYPDWEPEDY